MLRASVREGTELAWRPEIMDSGGLVGDEIMIGIVDDRLSRAMRRSSGYILDGFPRTVKQAEALFEITDRLRKPLDIVIDLDVPRDRVLERITARRVCRDCGTTTSPVRRPAAVDLRCRGGDVVQRDDDTPDAINQRLDLYESQTSPLIEFYGELEMLVVIDGVGHPDEVLDRLVNAIDQRRRPPA